MNAEQVTDALRRCGAELELASQADNIEVAKAQIDRAADVLAEAAAAGMSPKALYRAALFVEAARISVAQLAKKAS